MQHRQCTCYVTLWLFRVTISQRKQQCVLCVVVVVTIVELHVTLNYIKILNVQKNNFLANLRHRQQCKLYVFEKKNYMLILLL